MLKNSRPRRRGHAKKKMLRDLWGPKLLPPATSRAQFILRCTLSNPLHHSVIVGTASLQHLAENVAAAEAGPLPAEILQQVTLRVAAVQC